LFAAQAGVIALSPVLSAVAADFDVSTAAAGQLRLALGSRPGLRRSLRDVSAGGSRSVRCSSPARRFSLPHRP